jgi:beta-mannosidase
MKTIQIIRFTIFAILFNLPSAFCQTYLLHSNWQFKNLQNATWYPATVPGTVHTDLLANHLIQDPFLRQS